MDDYVSFIEQYGNMIGAHMASVKDFLSNNHIRSIGWEYNEAKNSQPENPFNVFTMASDLYYRENFHSDIIRVFLDPSENHNEGNVFLYAFIDFINDKFGDKVCISKQDYESAKAEREPGRIDILVSSEASKHCIIIENKMNNAPDTHRQLPKYYDRMTGLGYKVDAIVYLPLDANKRPDQSIWTETDKQHVLPLLCPVPAYHKKGMNLVNGWLEPCTLKTKNLDCVSVLRQYSELIKILSNNIMDNVILNKFYQSLINEKSLETALSVKNMLQDLPIFMADRLCDVFKTDCGDYDVWKYKPNFCGICFRVSGNQYKIDIWTSETGYTVHVFGQNQSERQMEWAEGMKSLSCFVHAENEYRRTDFTFYDEEKVIECVQAVIADMRQTLPQL